MADMINCKHCGKETPTRAVGTSTEKKFCSRTCQTRYAAKKRYHRLKNNKEFREKKRKYLNNWINKNREHFNNMVREPMRIHMKKKYWENDKLGLCVRCGRERDNPNAKNCLKCRPLKKK